MAEAARMFSLRRLERADNVERQELLTSLAHTRALIQLLWSRLDDFSLQIQRAVLDYIRFQGGDSCAPMLEILRDDGRDVKEPDPPAGGPAMTGSLAGAWGVAVMVALAALLLLHRPLGRLLRLAVRSSMGLAALALLNQIGLGLGVNLVNALILGVLGVPGLGLLLMLQWVLRT